jgi:hypothetical protein
VELETTDLTDLRRSKQLLEKTSFALRLANAVGKPVDAFVRALPSGASDLALGATHKALEKALAAAVWSLRKQRANPKIDLHKAAVITTGAVGGAFGFAALVPELTASTTVMLRAIAEIAREEGESLDSAETRLACLQVFALGGPGRRDDTVDTGYFAIRAAMATALEEAAQHVARRGMTREGAPVLVRFVTLVAARFGVPVSEKIVAQSVPLIGALGGASINLLFLAHFQDLARGHFIVRRLERKYGTELVREAYGSV